MSESHVLFRNASRGRGGATLQGAQRSAVQGRDAVVGQHGTIRVIGQGQYEQLQRTVFGQAPRPVFAVLDGAIVDDLPDRLRRHAPDATCLFSGSLDPMLAAAAPYLLELKAGSSASELALREGWNDHWGIVLVADAGTTGSALRSHLRRILRVSTPGGQSMLFRFYDPRAFRAVVPALAPAQRKEFFGPIHGCYIENRSSDSVLYFARDAGPEPRAIPLAA